MPIQKPEQHGNYAWFRQQGEMPIRDHRDDGGIGAHQEGLFDESDTPLTSELDNLLLNIDMQVIDILGAGVKRRHQAPAQESLADQWMKQHGFRW